jgi:hypothetical protein
MKKRYLILGFSFIFLANSAIYAETTFEAQPQAMAEQPLAMDGQNTATMEKDIEKIIGLGADGKQQVAILGENGMLRSADDQTGK